MDTIVISSYETKTSTPNLVMSILIAITVTLILLSTFPVSGGHINPVITLAALFTGLVSVSRAAIYISAQCAGAILGALALKAVVSSTTEQTFSLGGCTLNVTNKALWMEILCTFLFLFMAIWIAFDGKLFRKLGRVVVFTIIGLVVGLIVFISTTLTGTKGYSGVGMNPARCLGPAIVRGGHLWTGHWIFWVGPIIACVAFALYAKIIPKENLFG
ncbi:Probable aquaporin PIP2-7 [Linum perenne]